MKHCKEGHLMDSSWKYCPVCIAPLAGWLVELRDGAAVKTYTIHEGKSYVGSGADCEIRILGKGVSRRHIYLSVADGLCDCVDLGNGEAVKINKSVQTRASLIDGDIIELGALEFKIKLL